jgi:hypothetical protein
MPKPKREENQWIEVDGEKCLIHLEWDGDYWRASDASFPYPIRHRTRSGALGLPEDACRKYHSKGNA